MCAVRFADRCHAFRPPEEDLPSADKYEKPNELTGCTIAFFCQGAKKIVL